ncbi:MAG: bifunctional (p)ppGpp synthetase/guanosine-3',5'-bis(diphosphate) 3'-pyrophosphohydrolase [Chlorobi bacterium]|nr:MAG: (p)ppGpp synthetase I, SpoT/RelA [Chlorobi bacterium OLB7]MBK8912454.1 bifunctional (p)ppGpp synthetase/guanosine-3',5'-bis(diphosphate) 3'-pyrophosphohydrolase [Chlorobiota bacterium]MBX7217640.1 HD domain-containing protein [Candidatus Kapabacteria bacterium]
MTQPKFDTSYNRTWLPLQELATKIAAHISPADWLRVSSAYEMAENIHLYQKRNDGTPYFWHCTRVVKILTHELDVTYPNLIIAAILHDSLEDSDILNHEILEYNFGSDVSSWVEILTKQVRVKDEAEKLAINTEYRQRIQEGPIECQIIKLADRLDNTRCIQFNLKRNPFSYIQETREHYLPMTDGSARPELCRLAEKIVVEMNRYLG